MPNAKCDKCHHYLENICVNNQQKILLINLIKKRAKKKFGIVYNIDPGITHNEIDPENKSFNGNNCDGLLWYNHFSKNPKGFEDIDLSKILFDSINIEEIEKKLLKKIPSLKKIYEKNKEKDGNYFQVIKEKKDENNCQVKKDKRNETQIINTILYTIIIFYFINISYDFYLFYYYFL